MQEINVKNVIICKQPETSENFEIFLEIIKQKGINVILVEKGDKIPIEKNIFFYVLWPDSSDFIKENTLNNNSLVCNLYYKDFSILFTGDIEEETEKKLIKLYSNTNILSASILKVAHHGSKSSSTEDFMELVKPKIALIGVGKSNLYGHPNLDVLTRINNFRCDNL